MPKMNLQFRVIALITGLSFLLLSVFTYIQIQGQLEKLLQYNKLRAKVGTLLVKTTLEILFKDIAVEEALPAMFDAAIKSFAKQKLVEKVSIMTMDGKAIATNDPIVKIFGETRRDIKTYFKLSKESNGEKLLFYSALNKKNKSIDIFIPINIANKAYLTKLSFSIEKNVRQAIIEISVPLMVTAVAVIVGNILLGFILIRTVAAPIKELNEATKHIAAGNLNRRVDIKTRDEIEELGETFNTMAVALKKMKEIAEGSNPLTGLPGNNVIREEVDDRIRKGVKFVAIHVDIDHFKAYNDKYGISKGDEVIKFTAQVLKTALREKGAPRDFIGHEGGDDYFLITTPENAASVTTYIISEFDQKIKDFYNTEDIKIGYIVSENRQGNIVKFPLMSISLAGVTNDKYPIENYGELTNIAVGVKKKAKEKLRSNFYLDQRYA